MPLFGKSAAKRYEEMGPVLTPDFCDPATLSAIDSATAAVISYCGEAARFRPGSELTWQPEIKRLVMDGYFLGRVEEGTEKDRLRFSAAELKVGELEKLFTILCIGAVKNATSGEVFTATAPHDREIEQMLRGFCEQSARTVLESVGEDEVGGVDWRRFGSVASASIHLGREIALVEGYFLNPKKRKQLNAVLQAVRDVGNEWNPG